VGWNGGSQHVAGWNMIVGQQNQLTVKRKKKKFWIYYASQLSSCIQGWHEFRISYPALVCRAWLYGTWAVNIVFPSTGGNVFITGL
jgi:hypothetical protein